MIWKEAVVVCQSIIPEFPGGTDENRGNRSEYLVSRPSIELGTCTAKLKRFAVSDHLLDSILIENP
jgi:hypothetical protein